jgi:mannose-6-phosphate isomerase-like protein (cupin superfamily)
MIILWLPAGSAYVHAGPMHDALLLAQYALHLDDELAMHAHECDQEFWLDRGRPEFGTGRIVSVFSYEHTWDFQERHPTGDELAYVVSGEVDLLLEDDNDLSRTGGERAVRLAAGLAGVVPPGFWHRLAVRKPCTVLFITPVPAATEHRSVTV